MVGCPRVVRDAARALGDRVERWVYVSSRSVYSWPIPQHGDELAAVVEADPDAEATDYRRRQARRGAGAGARAGRRPGRAPARRPHPGPRENVGRLPWWLRRIARGGDVLAPGPEDLGIQYVDARDLARLGLDAAEAGSARSGRHRPPIGAATMGELLRPAWRSPGSDARLVWTSPALVLDHRASSRGASCPS